MKYMIFLIIFTQIISCSNIVRTSGDHQRSLANFERSFSCQGHLNKLARNSKSSTYNKILSSSKFNWKSILNKPELNIDDILRFKKRNGATSLEVEYAVNRNLYNNYEQYGIKVDRILEFGENGLFLKKELIDSNRFANVLIKNGKLSKEQLKKLKQLFKNAKEYARQTGIGLDLKAENLNWDGSDWVLFDTGPRTSYLPYGFTLDIHSFNDYLKVWMKARPNQTSKSIEIKNLTYLLSEKIQYKDLINLKKNQLLRLLKRKLNDWTGSISRSDIEVIVDSVPRNDRVLALNILKRITNLSDITGLQKFLETLNKFADTKFPGHYIFVGNNGGIGSALSYLNRKIIPNSELLSIFRHNTLKGLQKGDLILIDARTDISFLKKNAKQIRNKNLTLLHVHGLEDYLGALEQTTPDVFAKTFSKFYDLVQNKATETSSILDIKKKLKKLGLLDNLKVYYYDEGVLAERPILFHEKTLDINIEINDIVKRTRRVIPLKKIKKFIKEKNKSPQEIKEYLAALLPFSHFSSLQKMAFEAKTLHQQIKNKMSKKNIDMKNVYFYTRNTNKSFQVASWIFAKVNHISQDQFYDQQVKSLPSNSKMVIILDDFSGTGSSLIGETHGIKDHANHQYEVMVASFYATDLAKEYLRDWNQKLFIGKNLKSLNEANFPKDAIILKEKSGYGKTNSAFSLEYMSPDNNNRAFNEYFAPLFTLLESSIK